MRDCCNWVALTSRPAAADKETSAAFWLLAFRTEVHLRAWWLPWGHAQTHRQSLNMSACHKQHCCAGAERHSHLLHVTSALHRTLCDVWFPFMNAVLRGSSRLERCASRSKMPAGPSCTQILAADMRNPDDMCRGFELFCRGYVCCQARGHSRLSLYITPCRAQRKTWTCCLHARLPCRCHTLASSGKTVDW